jgi:hypothetical protein
VAVEGLREFEAALVVASDALERVVGDAVRDLVAESAKDLVATSPVLTGAYRASHQVSRDGTVVFESPNRPGSDEEILPGFGDVIPAPEISELISALEGVAPFANFQLFNQRFYAEQLEFGTSAMAPRPTYTNAENNARASAEAKARQTEQRLLAESRR